MKREESLANGISPALGSDGSKGDGHSVATDNSASSASNGGVHVDGESAGALAADVNAYASNASGARPLAVTGASDASGALTFAAASAAVSSMPIAGALAGVANVLHLPVRRRVASRKVTVASCICAAVVLVVVVVAGQMLSDTAQVADFSSKGLAPSAAHLFGTDWMGRDMFARTVAGLSTSILVGLLAATVSAFIALVLAAVAALGGKRADAAVTWLVDLFMGIPHIVLLILISYALGKGFWGVTIAVAVTHWPSLTRVLRAEIMQCRESQFVAHARKLGRSGLSIARTHMVPYVLPQFIIGLVLLFPHAIMHEAAITFLGFGLPPDIPAIGIILSESMSYLSAGMWWLALFPGLALIATVMLFDVVGSNVRRIVDPQSAQE